MDYSAWWPLPNGVAFECAGCAVTEAWTGLFPQTESTSVKVSYLRSTDIATCRCVVMREGRITFAFFASAEPVQVSRVWLQQQLLAEVNLLVVLAGRPRNLRDDAGAIVCTCMNVGSKALANAITCLPSATLDMGCQETGAGTGCGTCRLEIRKMIDEGAKRRQAAE